MLDVEFRETLREHYRSNKRETSAIGHKIMLKLKEDVDDKKETLASLFVDDERDPAQQVERLLPY